MLVGRLVRWSSAWLVDLIGWLSAICWFDGWLDCWLDGFGRLVKWSVGCLVGWWACSMGGYTIG